jgi:hypothetical protein
MPLTVVPVPIVAPFALNVTVPVALEGETTALSVKLPLPKTHGFLLDESIVVVGVSDSIGAMTSSPELDPPMFIYSNLIQEAEREEAETRTSSIMPGKYSLLSARPITNGRRVLLLGEYVGALTSDPFT